MACVWLLNGPNLNLLGKREPSIYGKQSLRDIEDKLKADATSHDIELVCKQTNSESEMIEWLQTALHQSVDFIIFNPAAWAHTSLALRDTLLAIEIPFIEVHMSNIFAREPFRQHSFLSNIAAGVILGLGSQVYDLALTAVINRLSSNK